MSRISDKLFSGDTDKPGASTSHTQQATQFWAFWQKPKSQAVEPFFFPCVSGLGISNYYALTWAIQKCIEKELF